MKRKRLAKIAKELAAMRRNAVDIKPKRLVRIAKSLGRRKVKRGDEPNYASPELPDLGHPLSIPNHPVLKPGTARSVIDILLSDTDIWRQHLDATEPEDDSLEDDVDGDEDDEGEDETNDDDETE
jgi:hypothetical protein